MLILLLSPLLLMSTAAGLGVSDWDKPWFCHDLDCPIYTVQEKTDMYEVRKYEAGVTTATHHVACPCKRTSIKKLLHCNIRRTFAVVGKALIQPLQYW